MSTFTIDPLTPAIGAEISGYELSPDTDEQTLDKLYQALLDHQVLIFRNQHISPETHLAFAQSFGELNKPHPIYPAVDGYAEITKLENDGDRPPDTAEWHTDMSFRANPPFASVLWSNVIPKTGGDTLWSSLYSAYDDLPEDWKTLLADKQAIHDMGSFRNNFAIKENPIEELNAAMGNVGQAIHPIVKIHPITGRKYLYVNQSFTAHIVGMTARESDRTLQFLFDHLDQPEFQVRLRWTPHTLVMWDNRVTQHYAVADYLPNYRCMHRITVVNDRRANAG